MESKAVNQRIEATDDRRTVNNLAISEPAKNNVMRHQYRVLTDAEKGAMQKLKDDGLALHDYITSLGTSRELSIAKTKLEECVMWATKHLTA